MDILENFNFPDYVVQEPMMSDLLDFIQDMSYEEFFDYLINVISDADTKLLFLLGYGDNTDDTISILEKYLEYDVLKPESYKLVLRILTNTRLDSFKLGKKVIEIFESYGKIRELLEKEHVILTNYRIYNINLLQCYCMCNNTTDKDYSEIIRYVIRYFTKYNYQMAYTNLDILNKNIFHYIHRDEKIVGAIINSIWQSPDYREIIDKLLAVQDLPENVATILQSIRDSRVKCAQYN